MSASINEVKQNRPVPNTSLLWDILQPRHRTHVVDIGANPIDGDPPYKPMLELGLCTVVGFEPQPEAFAELLKRRGPFEYYLPYAVGDGGTHRLKICRAPGMTSLLEPDEKMLRLFNLFPYFGEVVATVEIETKKLDDIAEIDSIDFLKIDIQGGGTGGFSEWTQKTRKLCCNPNRSFFCTAL